MKNVLIVEDDSKAVSVYSEALARAGLSVSVASTAKEAQESLKVQLPDLILLDIMLPGGMNGFDLLEAIKKNQNTANIPVVVLTNLDSEKEVALKIGANKYLVKANTSIDEITATVLSFFK